MRRKINVTASEMMELRKQGMSNYDLRRYIGTQGGKKMERLEAFKDKPVEKKQAEAPVFVPYTPKTRIEVFDINVDFEAEINYEDKYITFVSYEGEMNISFNISFKDVYDLTQFLAWLMRERALSVESDADAE